jgi:WD40 repeat protein
LSGPFADSDPSREANPSQSSASIASADRTSRSVSGGSAWLRGKAAAKIGLQVARALEYAHRQGTLHRDIKPSNILVDGLGTAWVTDFGLAKAAEDEDLTRSGDLVGTLRYMAPERLRGKADARSDVYALGLTLYELLSLRAAFDGTDHDQLIYQVMQTEPPRVCRLVPSLSRDLETIVHKAIEKNPDDRYQTAAMMAEDLRCFLEDQPIGARRVGSTERIARWARRNPWLAGLCLAVVVLLAVIAVGASVAAIHLQRKNEQVMTYLGKALEAETNERRRLAESLLAEARASRRRTGAGRRSEALAALNEARELVTNPDRRRELRDEAVACLALTDLELRRWRDEFHGDRAGLDVDFEFARYARGLTEGEISLRDATDDRELARLPGSGARPAIVRFSPDGRLLAVKYEKAKIGWVELCVWDLEKRSPILRVADGVTDDALDFRPDSEVLASGRSDGSISFFDLKTGREFRREELGRVAAAVRFDSTGRRLAVAHPPTTPQADSGPWVEIVSASERGKRIVYTLPEGTFDVQWQPDGQVLAAGGLGGNIYLLDAEQRRPMRVLAGHFGAVVSLTFHPDGSLLASGSWDGSLRLWHVNTGEELLRTPMPYCYNLRFSRNGRSLGPGCDGPSFWFWDVTPATSCRRISALGGAETVTWGISFHPEADLLASAGHGGVRLVAPRRGQVLAFLNLPGTQDAFFDADGRSLITSGRSGLLRWPLKLGFSTTEESRLGPAQPLGLARGLPTGRGCSALGGTLMAIAIDRELGQALVEDRSRPGRRVKVQGHPGLERVALSPDGRWLATGTWRGTGVKIWDAQSGELERSLAVEDSADVVFSPDGKRLVTSSGNEFSFWDVGTWNKVLSVARENAGGMPGKLAFSPSDRLAALTRTRDMIELIDPANGRKIATLESPDLRLASSLGFSPDGALLAVTYHTNSIRIWDLEDLRRGLAKLDLDWDEPATTPARKEQASWSSPGAFKVELPIWLMAMQEADELASKGRYAQAAKAYGTVIDAGAVTPDICYRQAVLFLAAGQIDEYRRACRAIVERFGEDVPPLEANTIAWTLVLGANAPHDAVAALRFARSAVASYPSSSRVNTLGGALFRAGRGPEAIQTLSRGIDNQGRGGTPLDWVFMALAAGQEGRHDDARRWLNRVSAWEATPSSRSVGEVTRWDERLELQILRAEAESQLSPRKP